MRYFPNGSHSQCQEFNENYCIAMYMYGKQTKHIKTEKIIFEILSNEKILVIYDLNV